MKNEDVKLNIRNESRERLTLPYTRYPVAQAWSRVDRTPNYRFNALEPWTIKESATKVSSGLIASDSNSDSKGRLQKKTSPLVVMCGPSLTSSMSVRPFGRTCPTPALEFPNLLWSDITQTITFLLLLVVFLYYQQTTPKGSHLSLLNKALKKNYSNNNSNVKLNCT